MWSRLKKQVEAMSSAAAVRHENARTNAYVEERLRNNFLISPAASRAAAARELPAEHAQALPAAAP